MFFFSEILEVRPLKSKRRRARKWVPLGFPVPPPGPEKDIPRRLQWVGANCAALSVLVFRTRAFAIRAASRAARAVRNRTFRMGNVRLSIRNQGGSWFQRLGRAARLATRAFFPPCRGLGRPYRQAPHGPPVVQGKANRSGPLSKGIRARQAIPSGIRKTLAALPLLLLQHLRNGMAAIGLDAGAHQSDVRGNETARRTTAGAKPRKRNRMLDSPYGMHLPIFPACWSASSNA
ncbi:hypothetical protein ACVMGC_003668 [Bradyrhizobium barranii subsp. barranii]